ncbi:TetR/AcrR family transcriptional regulator, partial [Gemmatimonadota bacterium]
FAQHGFEATTMDMIAEASEVSKGTVYNYFSNKQELFRTLIEWGSGRAREIGMETLSLPDTSRVERLGMFIQLFLEFFETGRDIHKILVQEGDRAAVSMKDTFGGPLRENYMQLIGFISEFISEGQNEGVFREMNPHKAAFFVLDIITAEFRYSVMTDSSDPLTDSTEETTRLILELLGAQEVTR